LLQLDCEPINGAVIELKKWNENLKLREKGSCIVCCQKLLQVAKEEKPKTRR